MTVELVGPNHYRVAPVGDGLPEDVARVEIIWEATDDEAVLKCFYHKRHIALSSKNAPPCLCISQVIQYRRDAFITDNQD